MNDKIKQKWVDALRSGEYTQGTGVLCNGREHCCLGVLCEIACEEGVVEKRQDGEGFLIYGKPLHGDSNGTTLPLSVMNWAGLDNNNPSVVIDGRGHEKYGPRGYSLTALNDMENLTFEQIADIIEKEL